MKLREQVAAELAKPANRRVLAMVDEERGVVNTYIAPTPYWLQTERAEQTRKEADHGQPDWSQVDEAGRGLVLAIALAERSGKDTGTDYGKLPSSLSDPEVADSWKRSAAWRAWIATPAEVRRAYVASVRSDLEQVVR